MKSHNTAFNSSLLVPLYLQGHGSFPKRFLICGQTCIFTVIFLCIKITLYLYSCITLHYGTFQMYFGALWCAMGSYQSHSSQVTYVGVTHLVFLQLYYSVIRYNGLQLYYSASLCFQIKHNKWGYIATFYEIQEALLWRA